MTSPVVLVPLGVPTPKTYTAPWLSVRTVQPSGCEAWLLSVAGLICCTVQMAPPSFDRAKSSGVGKAGPCELLRNEAQQTYTFPKNGLLAALSDQICSLSLKVVDDCFDTSTGGIQAFLSVMAPATSSVRETAMPSKPLNVLSRFVAPKLEVRLA